MSQTHPVNLNDLQVDVVEGDYDAPPDFVKSGNTTVHFKNIKASLIKYIKEADHIRGCVAWLTDLEIIDQLSKRHCQIVIQKEDFLRPDIATDKNWTTTLRKAYAKLGDWDKNDLHDEHSISYNDPNYTESIRCVGNHNADKTPAHPRMHHKFIVFCGMESKIHKYPKFINEYS